MQEQEILVGEIPLTLYVLEDGTWVLNDKMVAVAFGIKEVTVRRHYMRNKDVLIEGRHWIQLRNSRHWTKEGLIKLGNYVKERKAGALLNALGVLSRHATRIESDVVAIISSSFAGILQVETQHPIGKYKVDIYLPLLNLAIEIDEYAHESYDRYNEIIRELSISTGIGCEFIRWDAHAPDTNVGTLINKIVARLLAVSNGNVTSAVGTPVTRSPRHSPGRAVFPHPVPRLYSLSRRQ
jgi:very-short-patch-repair endonuclease